MRAGSPFKTDTGTPNRIHNFIRTCRHTSCFLPVSYLNQQTRLHPVLAGAMLYSSTATYSHSVFPSDIHLRNIRIYHECEGRIEKSVPRIAVWHHEACRVMTNGDSKGRNFPSYPHTNNHSFSCSPLLLFIYLYLKISFQKSLNTLNVISHDNDT